MGFGLEVDMIRQAREMDLLTTPYCFNPDEAADLARAGADILIPHMGLTTKGTIGRNGPHPGRVGKACRRCTTPPRVSTRTCWCSATARSPNRKDAQYILDNTEGIVGFYGEHGTPPPSNPPSPAA
ncbi:MAG: phosphoenolpyruvate hydrolase family protein [Pirellulales bacterium]